MAKQPITDKASKKPAAPIKVKQEMIDFIKTQGMTAALKRAGKIQASGQKGEAEFLEGIRRMYGANRLAAATAAAKPKAAPRGAIVDGMKKPSAVKSNKTTAKPAAKKGGMSTGAKITGGVAAAGLLIASRGKATGLAAKLSPTVAKALGARAGSNSAANVMAKKISSIKTAAADKAASTSGRVAAKAGKPVSQSQYEAMQAAAKAKGIKAPVKAAAKPAPKATVKKAALGAGVGATSLKGDTRKKNR